MLKRLVLGLWFGSCAAWSVPVVVDQTTTDFQFVFTGGTGIGAFVMGPATPPAGSGSVNFQLPDGDHSVGLQTSLFSGTLLSDITSFSYSTYITAFNGAQAPFVSLWVDWDGDLIANDRLTFEPLFNTILYGGSQNLATNTWQTWDLLSGNFYSVAGGGAPVTGPPASGSLFTLAQYVTAVANQFAGNPRILDPAVGVGGFRISSGRSNPTDVYNTNIDAITFGVGQSETTYDFELVAVPELDGSLASLPLAFSMASLLLVSQRRRRVAQV